MKELPLTQGHVALVDEEDYEELAQYKWYAHRHHNSFYARRSLPRIKGSRICNKAEMHQIIMGAKGIDHINGNGLDNRRSNLRRATPAQNNANRRRLPANKSGRRGVTWHRGCDRWQAMVHAHGKSFYLGLFSDVDDAARAYDKAARELFGEFAVLNFGSPS